MRARNIKPAFFKSEQLAACTLAARLLFPGLWMLADRCGYLEDRPTRIKAEVFPYEAVDVNSLLQELEEQGLIQRYVHDRKGFIFIPNFKKHQNPHQNEKRSSIPAPEHSDASIVPASDKQHSKPADSLLLNPETLKRNQKKTVLPERLFLPDWIPKKDWEDFCEMRKRINAAMTVRACELLLQKLSKLRDEGHPPDLILQQSILNSWKSVFPLKGFCDEASKHNYPTGSRSSKTDRLKAAALRAAEQHGFAPECGSEKGTNDNPLSLLSVT